MISFLFFRCFKWACCPCSPLLALLLTLAGVILAIALAAALVALLSKSSSSSPSTSTVATTVSSTSASSVTTVSSTSTTETSTSTSATTVTSTGTSTVTTTSTSGTSTTTTVTSTSTSTVTTTSTSVTSTTTSATTTGKDLQRRLSYLSEGMCEYLVPILVIGVNDTLVGLWQTTSGGSGTLATPGWNAGNYVAAEPPRSAFDGNCLTKFTSFGTCSLSGASATVCGLQTGFYVTLQRGATVMKALQFCTGNDNPPRDPLTMTLEGSNQTGSALMLGSSWSLVYNGITGLATDPGRQSLGVKQTFSSNTIAYSSYRFLITSKRAADIATQYSELNLFAF